MTDITDRFFTPTQKKIVATALAGLAICFLVFIAFGVFLILREFLTTFSDVFMPLAIAGVLAMLLKPVLSLFESKLKLSRIKAIVLLFALVIVVLLGIVSFAVPIVFSQLQALLTFLPQFAKKLHTAFMESYPGLIQLVQENVGDEELDQIMSQAGAYLRALLLTSLSALDSAKTTIFSFFGMVAAYAVIPIYLFYILDSNRNYKIDLKEQLSFLKEEHRQDLVFLVAEFVKILVAFFRGQIIIAFILAIMLAAGFSLVGLKFGIILGLVIGLLNIVPYLGTILGLSTVLPIAYFQPDGGFTVLGLCVLVFIIAQLITDYLLTPKIMGKETGLGAMAIIFSIFFWGTALNGLLGMILAIPLSAFFVIFWRLAKKKYIPEFLGRQKSAAIENTS